MPVIVQGAEVDRLLLNRVDPDRFRFTVRNDPTGSMNIDEWEQAFPQEVLIVNSSYYDNKDCRRHRSSRRPVLRTRTV